MSWWNPFNLCIALNFLWENPFHPEYHPFLMKFVIFGLGVSVDIRPLPGAWVSELLSLFLGVKDHTNQFNKLQLIQKLLIKICLLYVLHTFCDYLVQQNK